MTRCAFFGHSESFVFHRVESCPEEKVRELILKENVDAMLVDCIDKYMHTDYYKHTNWE